MGPSVSRPRSPPAPRRARRRTDKPHADASSTGQQQLEMILNLLYPCAPRKQSTIRPIRNLRGITMKTPLDSIAGTIITGLALTVILYFFVVNFLTKTAV